MNLIRACKKGDLKAFDQLIRELHPYAYNVACHLCKDPEEAGDIVQESMIKLWQNIRKYNEKHKIKTWLYRIVYNTWIDHIRKNNKKQFSEITEIEAVESQSPEEALIYSNQLQIVYELKENLPPRQKSVFILRDLEGLKMEEVSKITGLKNQQIKSNLYHARKFLKEEMERINRLKEKYHELQKN